MLIEKAEVLVPQETKIIPAYVKRPEFRESIGPLKRGDIVELIVNINGIEDRRLKTVIENDPSTGMEVRPLVTLHITEMNEWSKAEVVKEEEEIIK